MIFDIISLLVKKEEDIHNYRSDYIEFTTAIYHAAPAGSAYRG
jgi:hypothetical protein